MKIAINHTRFASTGGIEKYIHSLVRRFLDAGDEVHCFVRRWEPLEHERLSFHRVPALPLGEGMKALSFAYASARRLRRESFDVVLGFSKTFVQDIYIDGSGLFSTYRRYLRSAPILRRLGKFRPLLDFAYVHTERRRFGATRPPLVFAMSEMAKDQILTQYPQLADRVAVSHPAIDASEFRLPNADEIRRRTRDELGVGPERTVFIVVGSDFRRKGVTTALQALKASGRLDACLWVVGHDRRLDDYERYARRLGVDARFLGACRPHSFLAAADVFAFPSRYDIFGIAVLEAWAAGLPALVSSAAGASELVRPGENGLVVRSDSPVEWAQAMASLCDPVRRTAAARRARETAEACDWGPHFQALRRACGAWLERAP